jgi:hypothetical protein
MSVLVVTQMRDCITPCLRADRRMVCGSGNVWPLARIGLALPTLRRPSGYGPLANNAQTLIAQGAKRIKARITKQWRRFHPQI